MSEIAEEMVRRAKPELPVRRKIANVFFFLWTAAGAIYAFAAGLFATFALNVVIIVGLLIVFAMPLDLQLHFYRNGKSILLFLVVLLSILLSFTTGYDLARSYLSSGKALSTLRLKDGESIPIKVIRAGQNGLLYLDVNGRHVEFIKMDEVRAIESL